MRSKNAHKNLYDILPRHWHRLAQSSGMPELFQRVRDLATTMAPRLDGVAAQLPQDFPESLWGVIRRGVEFQVERFLHLCKADRVGA